MAKLTWLISVMLVLTAAGLQASSEAPASVEAQFLELELRWMNALADKDAALLESMLAPEFTIIGATSTLEDPVGTRENWLAVGLKRPFPRHEVKVLGVTVIDDTAVVRATLSATYPPSSFAPEGGPVTFLVTDTWVKRANAWQVVSRHASFPHHP